MCCLFGIINYSGSKFPGADELVNCLAQEATERGIDSTGIAYNKGGKLVVYKKPLSAWHMNFKGLESCVSVTGHTRHATQGSAEKNYNNHPFYGRCDNAKFALSHNGVLWNDSYLRNAHNIPKDRIQTDSYIAVQLLEKFGVLSVENVRKMAELVSGSFAFTMTDTQDTTWIIKGSSPISLIHFPNLQLYAYASTDSILFTALCQTDLVEDIKSGEFEMISVKSGDIVRIDRNGNLKTDRFTFYDDYSGISWWNYSAGNTYHNSWEKDYNREVLEDLKTVAQSLGIEPELIDELYNEGFTIDELEEFIYFYDYEV